MRTEVLITFGGAHRPSALVLPLSLNHPIDEPRVHGVFIGGTTSESVANALLRSVCPRYMEHLHWPLTPRGSNGSVSPDEYLAGVRKK